VDADFGTPNPSLYGTYEDGPFYLLPYTMVVNGTIGGLKIDFESQVLREDGSAIPGLYAAGETCNGEYMYRLYPSGGASLLFGSVTGKIAGANAAKLAKA
jgi:succinate dehydrogenase/fumarate reductase flavoprotein subunit